MRVWVDRLSRRPSLIRQRAAGCLWLASGMTSRASCVPRLFDRSSRASLSNHSPHDLRVPVRGLALSQHRASGAAWHGPPDLPVLPTGDRAGTEGPRLAARAVGPVGKRAGAELLRLAGSRVIEVGSWWRRLRGRKRTATEQHPEQAAKHGLELRAVLHGNAPSVATSMQPTAKSQVGHHPGTLGL